VVHGIHPGQVLHFDYLYVGASGPMEQEGLDERDGFKYILVIMDDLSNFVWLEPAGACTAAVTAQHLVQWCKTIGVPETWVSDTASHFKNKVMSELRKAFRVDHQFAVAYSPWSNGTCERMMREVVRALKAMLNEKKRDTRDWVGLVPAVQWALNTAFRERYGSTPYHVMYGRAPGTSFEILASAYGDAWKVDVLDSNSLQSKVADVVDAQENFHKQVSDKVRENRERQRRAADRGVMPNFDVGDYVLVARVRKRGVTPKLVSTWTGPWRVVTAETDHLYGVQNIVSGDIRDVHVARLRYYADRELGMTAQLKDVFQHSFA